MAASAVREIDRGWQHVLDSADPEGAHTLRIGLRRLRVVLHVFRRELDGTALAPLGETLAGTARDASRLRDLDVLIGDIVVPLFAVDPVVGGPALIATLEADRVVVRAELRRLLTNKDARALRRKLGDLPPRIEALIARADTGRALPKMARRDLKKRWRKISRQAADLDALNTEELHEVRKTLKNLRYAFASFAPFWGRKTAVEFEGQLKRLQNAFGYLNDVAVAKQLETHAGADAGQTEINCAIGYVLGWHTERALRARSRIKEKWQQLGKTKLARELAG